MSKTTSLYNPAPGVQVVVTVESMEDLIHDAASVQDYIERNAVLSQEIINLRQATQEEIQDWRDLCAHKDMRIQGLAVHIDKLNTLHIADAAKMQRRIEELEEELAKVQWTRDEMLRGVRRLNDHVCDVQHVTPPALDKLKG
jgi:hypothetical protein